MKRLAVLLALLTVGAVSIIFAKPQTQQRPPVALEIEKVKDNLYMITGAGGNTAAFITETGVVIVDTKVPGMGPAILEKVKSITAKPVTMVINTHTHFDHVGSNIAFTGMVEFVAHENCKTSMEKMAAFQSDEGKKFLPGKTYKDKLSLLKGNDKIDLHYFGRGHTSGDTFVVFPALRVMHAGDMFAFTNGLPFIDIASGGSGLEFPRTLMKAAAGIKGVERVIPGHSPVTDFAAFKAYGEFLQAFVSAVEQAKKDGKTIDQAAADLKLPEKFKDYNLSAARGGVTAIYSELK
jgi:glyoxylase-like metal-dependent hydrolase (beta-lactamase superfamily II)